MFWYTGNYNRSQLIEEFKKLPGALDLLNAPDKMKKYNSYTFIKKKVYMIKTDYDGDEWIYIPTNEDIEIYLFKNARIKVHLDLLFDANDNYKACSKFRIDSSNIYLADIYKYDYLQEERHTKFWCTTDKEEAKRIADQITHYKRIENKHNLYVASRVYHECDNKILDNRCGYCMKDNCRYRKFVPIILFDYEAGITDKQRINYTCLGQPIKI